ncbi:lysophospholipid acyltransferase family protein [Luteipulveratus mongoliensis]|uniref:Acyl-phosphate glycerol 3-phosphate acyltransferase n=1 Tax=Luteipulveratus mongoliensis TaxID=571913 RepID=A0A0K1JN91_9MICO|nr:lysophospholipid acyltransferase family protein [Luteipulveratus mongoliensis]AKU18171.1 acyl-phosphate glycerol 3-phosphate acyltransferase [Luteipulveratus mongoliensis]
MLYLTSRMVVAPALRAVFRPTVEGRENVPRTGAVILASNHLSFVDSVVIPMVAPRQVHFLAKSSYFTGTGLKGAALRMWMTSMGMIPVERDDTRAAANSLEIALRVLNEGKAFGIYPEGTRSRDGRLYRGRTGVAHLALETGAPVVPVGIEGTPDIQPIGSNRPRVAHATIRFGEPLRFVERYAGVPAGKARRQVTDEIMDAIHELTGQERAGTYNEHPPAT